MPLIKYGLLLCLAITTGCSKPATESTNSKDQLAYYDGKQWWIKSLPDGEPQSTTSLTGFPLICPECGEPVTKPRNFANETFNPEDIEMEQSPNGVWTLFATRKIKAPEPVIETEVSPEKEDDNLSFEDSLWLKNNQSGELSLLSKTNEQIGLRGWSVDSQYMFLWHLPEPGLMCVSCLLDGVRLEALNINTKERKVLLESVLMADLFIAYSPKGNQLAVVDGGDRETGHDKIIVILDLVNSSTTRITDDKLAAITPTWSPDGQTLAYVAEPDSNESDYKEDTSYAERKIYLYDLASQTSRQLTHDHAFQDEYPQWLSDGSGIVFVRITESGASIWQMPVTGENPKLLVEKLHMPPSFYGNYHWKEVIGLKKAG